MFKFALWHYRVKFQPVFHSCSQNEKENDVSEGRYGNLPLNQSQEKIQRKIYKICELTPDLADKKVWVRARLHTSRAKGWYLKSVNSPYPSRRTGLLFLLLAKWMSPLLRILSLQRFSSILWSRSEYSFACYACCQDFCHSLSLLSSLYSKSFYSIVKDKVTNGEQ